MPATPIGHLEFCDRLEPLIHRFADVVDGADFATPVPSCGDDWSLADLVEHVGMIHRWAERLVRDLSPARIDRAQLGVEVPAPGGLSAWLRAGAAPLAATLRASDPAAPMWAWGADQHARFWSRRQVHETAVHLHDAECAVGAVVSPVDAGLAADGVDEFLVNLPMAARWVPAVAGIRGEGEEIALRAHDLGVEWTITLHPDGFAWARERAAAPAVRIDANAESLYLLLWKRRSLDECAFRGDRALVESLLAKLEDL